MWAKVENNSIAGLGEVQIIQVR